MIGTPYSRIAWILSSGFLPPFFGWGYSHSADPACPASGVGARRDPRALASPHPLTLRPENPGAYRTSHHQRDSPQHQLSMATSPARILGAFPPSARLLLASVCFSIVACSGSDGAVGPQGPSGNANVQSKVVPLTSAQWLWNSTWSLSTGGGASTQWFTRYVDLNEPLITASILTSGMVLVYFQPTTNATAWASLPYSFQGFSNFYHFQYEVSAGKIRLHYYWTALPGSTIPTGLSTFTLPTYTFKYVVVEGTAIAPMLAARTNMSDPGAVERFLATHNTERAE